MKTKAAVAFAAGKPLEIVELDLEGPRSGEVRRTMAGKGSERLITRKGESVRPSPRRGMLHPRRPNTFRQFDLRGVWRRAPAECGPAESG